MGLNPYSTGRYSLINDASVTTDGQFVLILILLEDTL